MEILQQFLISDKNVNLELHNSLKGDVNVLSIPHMRFKERNPRRKQINKRKKKIHYGSFEFTKNKFPWAIDIPNGYKNDPTIFKNKCLIVSVILGSLQNQYYKSNRKDRRFMYAQNINSLIESKRVHAGNILKKELINLYKDLDLATNEDIDCSSLIQKLSEHFKCQIFIFDGINNSSKLKFLYPPTYDHELQPIYLFEPFNQPNHVMFIKCLSSYFRANVKVCFICMKTYKTYNYKHRCSFNLSCFACRCIFSNENTYSHEKLETNFCDGRITKEKSTQCKICNVTLYSEKCKKGHKLLCNGVGNFGWKCTLCNKFTYRQGAYNSKKIAENHQCGTLICPFCKQFFNNTEEHLCKLRKETVPNKWPNLAFLGVEFLTFSSSNCSNCFEVKQNFKISQNLNWKELYEHSNFSNLNCDYHEIENELALDSLEANLLIIYKENVNIRGQFDKHILTNLNYADCYEDNILNFNYVDNERCLPTNRKNTKKKKTQDLITNLKQLEQENDELSVINKFLKLICLRSDWQHTTFLVQDQESQILVRM
jgi:hypothetical protein